MKQDDDNQPDDYQLLDSGDGLKLERFKDIVLMRPQAQAVWKKTQKESLWQSADASFTRIDDKRWKKKPSMKETWQITASGIRFQLSTTEFGHIGIFPEQRPFWNKIRSTIQNAKRPVSVLNLFAYSGGSTIAAAQAGASVCHLDASKPIVCWAKENAILNNLENAPIRWITDDVTKFVAREVRRQNRYDAIILDPPTFGRGPKGELFKIEQEIGPLLESVQALLSENPLFVLFSCHTPGFTPIVLEQLVKQNFTKTRYTITSGEMTLDGPFIIPSGTYAFVDFQS